MTAIACLAVAWGLTTFVAVTALREQMYFRGPERFYLLASGFIGIIGSAASAFFMLQSLMT